MIKNNFKLIKKTTNFDPETRYEFIEDIDINSPINTSTSKSIENAEIKRYIVKGSVHNFTFKNVNFEQCLFDLTKFYNCDFINCNFNKNVLWGVEFEHCNFENCNIDAVLYNKYYHEKDCKKYTIVKVEDSLIKNCFIQGEFYKLELYETKIENCEIENVDIEYPRIYRLNYKD